MDLANISIIVSVLLVVWLSVLSFFVYKIYSHFTNLTDKVRGEDLMHILEKVLHEEKNHAEAIVEIRKVLASMQYNSEGYIQKIGLVRFNPFSDTGGEQSFSLGLLDKRDNGVILTGLHTRERTRVYVKPISKGKSQIDLSKEENRALQLAVKHKNE